MNAGGLFPQGREDLPPQTRQVSSADLAQVLRQNVVGPRQSVDARVPVPLGREVDSYRLVCREPCKFGRVCPNIPEGLRVMSFSIDISGFGPNDLSFIGSDGCKHDSGFEYRWKVIAALPFFVPLTSPLQMDVTLQERSYVLAIHNNLDRLLIRSVGARHQEQVRLIDRNAPIKLKVSRSTEVKHEKLKAVAIYKQKRAFLTTWDALENSPDKVRECTSHLSEFVFSWHRSLPYLATWVMHPISVYDLGIVYFVLEVHDPKTGRTSLGPAFHAYNQAKQFNNPLFHHPPPDKSGENPVSTLVDELLAEASSSRYRSMRRLAISNGYLAVEILANHVFKERMRLALLSQGLDAITADEQAESLRHDNDNKLKYLLHSGMIAACSRSLFAEDNRTYNQMLKCKAVRNDIQHRGYMPTSEECDVNLGAACETVRWLTAVIGGQPKSMHPPHVDPEALSWVINGFGATNSLVREKRDSR